MSDNRTAEELAGGFLRLTLGGSPREMPTLKIRAEREFKLLLVEELGKQPLALDWEKLREGGDETYAALAPLANMPTDLALTLLLAYDRGGALGGREWLEEHADSSEVYRALIRVLRVCFPFVEDLRGVMNELVNLRGLVAVATANRGQQVDSSNSLSSTNGHSPAGEPTPIG